MRAELAATVSQVIDMLVKKNKDYDNSYDKLRDEYGTIAFHVRLSDKIHRLKQVDKAGDSVGETSIDTIKDIIGYCLLDLRYRENKTKKETQHDT